jgi:cold shock protein
LAAKLECLARHRQAAFIFIGDFLVTEVFIGTVKFVSEKGYLFLIVDGGASPDVFGHIREWEANGLREPEQGERYQFEIEQRPKGPMAIKPRPVM